jgi:hypothetical protein
MEAVMAAMPASPRRFRRPLLWTALLTAAAVGTAGAAVGFLERGSTVDGVSYEITRSDRDGNVCLELRFDGGQAAYGCGRTPTAEHPLGLFVVDRRATGGIAYGLVDASIKRVRVAGIEAPAELRDGVPGRFFLVRGANLSNATATGVLADGRRVTLSGGGRLNPKPGSRAEAAAAGDPAGLAPSVDAASTVRYRGAPLPTDEAAARGLVCVQDDNGTECFDSAAEAAQRTGEILPSPAPNR